jgi:hypothetical protein
MASIARAVTLLAPRLPGWRTTQSAGAGTTRITRTDAHTRTRHRQWRALGIVRTLHGGGRLTHSHAFRRDHAAGDHDAKTSCRNKTLHDCLPPKTDTDTATAASAPASGADTDVDAAAGISGIVVDTVRIICCGAVVTVRRWCATSDQRQQYQWKQTETHTNSGKTTQKR